MAQKKIENLDEGLFEISGASDFGEWLRTTRIEKKKTVPELSEESGISVPQIYNIESGRSQNPQPRTREKLAKALGSEIDKKVVDATESESKIDDVGEFVDFDPHDENDYPDAPGIYVFYDISERPIYVGQTKNIKDRIRTDHYEKFWYKSPLVYTASYVKITDETLREKIERVMIKFMKSNAIVNKQYVKRK